MLKCLLQAGRLCPQTLPVAAVARDATLLRLLHHLGANAVVQEVVVHMCVVHGSFVVYDNI